MATPPPDSGRYSVSTLDEPTRRAILDLRRRINYGKMPASVTGSTDSAKLASLIAALDELGIITDNTT